MKKMTLFLGFFLCTTLLFAQKYTTAAGLRLGTDWGLTVQQRLTDRWTGEFILQSSLAREEMLVTALAEKHMRLVFKGINLYGGAGLHKGWNTQQDLENPVTDPFGVTLIGGAELTVGRLNFAYDFKPAINLSGGEKNFYTQSGISVRYVLIKDKAFKDWQKTKKKKKKQKAKAKKKKDQDHPDWMFWKD